MMLDECQVDDMQDDNMLGFGYVYVWLSFALWIIKYVFWDKDTMLYVRCKISVCESLEYKCLVSF